MNKLLFKKLLCPVFILSAFFVYGQQNELSKLKHDLHGAKDSLMAMRLLNKIGFLIHMKNADSSFYYGIKAERIALRFHDNRGVADALANIGIGLCLKGLYNQSLDYYSKAYAAYSKLPDTTEMAQMLMNSAITYSFTVDSNRTAEFAGRAINLVGGLKTDSATSMLYANYSLLGNLGPDSAAIYLTKAEKIAVKFNDDRALLFIMQQSANSLLTKKQFSGAEKLIKASIILAKKHDWDYHEMEGLDLYGSYYMAIKNPDSALTCYLELNRMADANDYVYWKIEVLKSILRAYKAKNNFVKQAETSQLLINAIEKNTGNNNSFLVDYIKYRESQEELKKLSKLNTLYQKKQFWFITAGVIGFITVIIVLFSLSRSRAQEKALKASNEKIKEQNQTLQGKDNFNSMLLSMLAHDFRAPLGQTLSMISLLKEDKLDHDIRLKFYNTVETSVKNILLTFDDILHWIKRQLMGYQLIPEKCNLHEMLEQSAEIFKHTIESKVIIFNNLLDPELTVYADRELIQFINRNLVHNAIKHSPVNGIIKATLKVSPEEVIVSVSNEGAGIPQHQLKNLFEFGKKESGESGAGMAMTLSREFITLLNGKIWAESKPGEGAVFFYSLPAN